MGIWRGLGLHGTWGKRYRDYILCVLIVSSYPESFSTMFFNSADKYMFFVSYILFVILQSGFTPFLLAVSENKLKMAKFLSMKNANVHATDNQKR